MKTIEIKGSLRNELGKKSARLIRNKGNVPCIIYGKEKNINFSAHENSFTKLVYTHEAHLVNLDIDGENYKAVMHDLQFHPVTDKILHVDFIRVMEDKPITMNIPVVITGDSAGVKAGGKLNIKRRHLKVRGLADDIPDHLDVDVTNLFIHQSIKVGDLAYDKVELIDPKISTVVSVSTSRVALKTEEEAAAETKGGEGAEKEAEAGAEEKGKEK